MFKRCLNCLCNWVVFLYLNSGEDRHILPTTPAFLHSLLVQGMNFSSILLIRAARLNALRQISTDCRRGYTKWVWRFPASKAWELWLLLCCRVTFPMGSGLKEWNWVDCYEGIVLDIYLIQWKEWNQIECLKFVSLSYLVFSL